MFRKYKKAAVLMAVLVMAVLVLTGCGSGNKDVSSIKVINVDMFLTMAVAVIMLKIGAYLCSRIKVFRKYCVPAPVVGGLLFAILSCLLYSLGVIEFRFDETLKNVFMLAFFTSVGFKVNLKLLKKGGSSLIVMIILVTVLIFFQNGLAMGVSKLIGIDPRIGLCTGSIPMVGGHGTSAAFGPLLEDLGINGATTLCTAAATFGLVAGSVMGAPLGRNLIEKKDLLKTAVTVADADAKGMDDSRIYLKDYAPAVYELAVAMGLGTIVSLLLSKTGLTFPNYIGSMIVAAVMVNTAEYTGKFKIYKDEISEIGGISLSIFLGIAMITLKLWQLADLALPLLTLLASQTVIMFLFARFIVFRALGHDYDAAVMTSGVCGFGMGATPNAMANMQALTDRYAPSDKAYLLIPIVGGMFVDFINSLVVTFFINVV